MNKSMNIVTQLHQAVDNCGLSLKRLSDLCQLPYATVHGFAKDDRDITIGSAAKLCNALNLELRPVRRKPSASKGKA